MDDQLSHAAPGDGWSAEFSEALLEQRARARTFLGAQRARLDQIEAELARQVDRVAAELEQDRRRLQDDRVATADESEKIEERRRELTRLRKELDDARVEFEQSQQLALRQQQNLSTELTRRKEELDAQESQLAETESRLRQQQRQIADERTALETSSEELHLSRMRFEEKVAQLDREREEHDRQRSETKSQRRRIAQELRETRAATQADLKRGRAELDQRQAEIDRRGAELNARRSELDQLAADVDARRTELDARGGDLELRLVESEHLAAAQTETIAELRRQLDESLAAVTAGASADERVERIAAELAESRAATARLEQEFQEAKKLLDAATTARKKSDDRTRVLEEQLTDAEKRLAEKPSGAEGSGSDERMADLQRRHEMLLDDLREQRTRNEKLGKELEAAKRGAAVSGAAAESNDWESQKRRLLASLEAETDSDPKRQQERLSIEETIRQTELIVAAKESEIEELRQRVDQQSQASGISDELIAAEVDKDEFVRQEREKLAQLQEEWREKLRQAEVDLSLERAKIARERMEIEEKLRQNEDERVRHADSTESGSQAKKPTRGKWLARLGLKDDEPAGD